MNKLNEILEEINKAEEAVVAAKQKLQQYEANKNKNPKLLIPELDDTYWSGSYKDAIGARRCIADVELYLNTFSSTNKAQAAAFSDALCVMGEMRVQEGIVAPNGNDDFYSISVEIDQKLSIDMWSKCIGLSLFPAFISEDAAQTAINAVGEKRIINCIKTMMFMTPESRGEVPNVANTF